MAVTPRQVKNKRDKEGKLTGRAGTVYDVNIKYKTPFGEKRLMLKKDLSQNKKPQCTRLK